MKILLLKFRNIGDVLLSTQLVNNLRHHYPNAQIDFCVNKETETMLSTLFSPEVLSCVDSSSLVYTSSVAMIEPFFILRFSVLPIVIASLVHLNILYILFFQIFHGRSLFT